jgi:hypothetical protein
MGMTLRIAITAAAHRTGPAVAVAALSAVFAAAQPAFAATRHHSYHASEAETPRAGGTPLMAVVSLKHQQVTVYDADGWILRAPVSTGMPGRETPAGVFAVIQKERDHYSNLYDDAYMPNMQRITWSGIALHGGPLPGHAASHGCIRMPYDFAGRLFERTSVGLRVIITPGDPAPTEITSAALPQPKPDDDAKVAALDAAADDATKKATEARLAAATATRESAHAGLEVRKLEFQKKRADAQAAMAAKAADAIDPDTRADAKANADLAKQKTDATVADVQTQLDAAKADQQTKLDAVTAARETATAADSARQEAANAAREAAHAHDPVSIFISRKTQKLYVRRGFEPLFDEPVTIRDPDRMIGTHVFTATAKSDSGLRWSVVTLTDGHPRVAEAEARQSRRDVEPAAPDTSAAKDALDRVTIPQDVLDRIAPGIAPRASIIISDEGLSSETGKGTDFVAVLSNEPQGGLSMRHHSPSAGREYRYAYPRSPSPYQGSGSYGGWPFGGSRWGW